MISPPLKAMLIGVAATVGSFSVGCAVFWGCLLSFPVESRGFGGFIFLPILAPLLLACIALGLWLSRRHYWHAITTQRVKVSSK